MSEEMPRGQIRKRGWSYGPQNWEESHENKSSAEVGLRHITRLLKEHDIEIARSKVLEVGSGKGYLLQTMKNAGIDAVAVDARPRGVESRGLVGARAEQLPFADDSFDVVIAEGVFDSSVYNQNHTMMLNEIIRVLKKDGVFYEAGASDYRNNPPQRDNLRLISNPEDADWEALYRKISN